ncbi:unnamed protein product [Anisakis simplex]|uniref:Uncharacterized protein n=1 Tax=Anisakis simplex TaxID=6269 RepID=A0A0M3JK25_ANISI|nr:unnamed protein product [Anisakis simplex]
MASVQLAASVGCAHWNTNFNDLKQTEKVLKCLRGVDAKRLIVQQRRLEDQGVAFSGPCIDGPHGVSLSFTAFVCNNFSADSFADAK